MRIGFTGTMEGMSQNQKNGIKAFLDSQKVIDKILHGGCIGADMDFHKMCEAHFTEVFPGHPWRDPLNTETWGDFEDASLIHEPQQYHKRNRDIVDNSDIILATPYNNIRKGGTWYTIGYAKKHKKTLIIFNR